MQWCVVAISCLIVEYQWMLLLLCHIVECNGCYCCYGWNFMIVDDHRNGSDDSDDDNDNDVNLFLYAKTR